jgi:hypothetical protein
MTMTPRIVSSAASKQVTSLITVAVVALGVGLWTWASMVGHSDFIDGGPRLSSFLEVQPVDRP